MTEPESTPALEPPLVDGAMPDEPQFLDGGTVGQPPITASARYHDGGITITWTAPTRHQYAAEYPTLRTHSGYEVFRNQVNGIWAGDGKVRTFTTRVGASTLSWTDTAAEAGNTYHYWVRATYDVNTAARTRRQWVYFMRPSLLPSDVGRIVYYKEALSYGPPSVSILVSTETGAEGTRTAKPRPAPTPSAGICGRTPQVRDAIMVKLNEGLYTPEVTDCAEVTAEDLGGITGAMELSIEEIPALKSGDFEGISNLNSLLMIDSGLETLPEDVFDGLTSLTRLYIIGNDDLEELPEGIFEGLTSLETLHVSGNAALGELPEGIFDGLTSLGFLHLAENSLTELPEDIFDGLTSLQLLHLQNNQLTGLPSGIFDDLGSLEYIRLNENALRSLPGGVFGGLARLKQLPLEGNELESLPDGVFEGLVNLEQVFLSSKDRAPFTLTAELDQHGDNALVVKVVEGSPFDLTVTLSARGGTLSSTTVTVEGGRLASEPVGVSVDGSGPAQVTVTVESATFPKDREHSGISIGLGQPLALDLPGSPQGQRGDGSVSSETVWVTAPSSVPRNAEATVAMSFSNLAPDSDTGTTDYIFRADVVDAKSVAADGCEGIGMGKNRYMYQVDEDPEVRAATISVACPPGDYTVEVSISSPDDVELASATADFTVAAPAQRQQPAQEPPPSTDAALRGLALSDVTLAFASTTTEYTASVANDVDETTVTPTTNDGGASYVVKLGGVADADGVIPLSVGSNVITVEVTAEDGNTARTYTVTVTRAKPLSRDATLSGLALSGVDFGKFEPATTSYTASVANDVDETTVTPTANDGGATYETKLGGVADADGVIPLAVGSNSITIEVTAEDGDTTRTYTVTVTRAGAAASGDPPKASDAPAGEVLEPGRVTLDWNDVAGADSYDVRYYDDDHWVELPTGKITIVFDGSGAEVSGLKDWSFYYFSVRAVNGAGASDWSEHNMMNSQE